MPERVCGAIRWIRSQVYGGRKRSRGWGRVVVMRRNPSWVCRDETKSNRKSDCSIRKRQRNKIDVRVVNAVSDQQVDHQGAERRRQDVRG